MRVREVVRRAIAPHAQDHYRHAKDQRQRRHKCKQTTGHEAMVTIPLCGLTGRRHTAAVCTPPGDYQCEPPPPQTSLAVSSSSWPSASSTLRPWPGSTPPWGGYKTPYQERG